ncbi:MAG: rhomboid family intramembrane serine protease [Chthoniobacterales bacterium]
MLDLNHLLLFIAVVSAGILLFRPTPRGAGQRNWTSAAVTVLLISGAAWMVRPSWAGFIGGTAWFCLLFLPAVGLRRAEEAIAAERYGLARWILEVLRCLHPDKTVRDECAFVREMASAHNGDPADAAQRRQKLDATDPHARVYTAQGFRVRGDWRGLLAWCRETVPPAMLATEPALLPFYFRALGETGALDELALQVAGRAPRLLASPQHQTIFDSSVLMLLAFTGRADAVSQLLTIRCRGLRSDVKEFWRATSELASGKIEHGRERLLGLQRTTRDALLRSEITNRIARASALPVALSSQTEFTVSRFEKNVMTQQRPYPRRSTLPTPAVGVLIALNVAMFLVETVSGGSTNTTTLLRLGAMEPLLVVFRGEYWRLFAALFLHYGPLHLFMNLYALYVLGPALENAIGAARFAICYVVAGLGSTAGVVLLWRLGLTRADLLVGASGAIMGIVGAWAALLVRQRHLPMARRRLATIGLIVVMQTLFDLYIPQVSMGAHLCGLATGFVAGFIFAPEEGAR